MNSKKYFGTTNLYTILEINSNARTSEGTSIYILKKTFALTLTFVELFLQSEKKLL